MAASSASSATAHTAGALSLRELHSRSAPLGHWDVTVFRAKVHKYNYTDRNGNAKEGTSFRCILVAKDDPTLYIAGQCTMWSNNMVPVQAAANKFANDLHFRISNVSLDTRAKPQYLHTPLKIVVEVGRTTATPLLREKDGPSCVPCPILTLHDCKALQQTQRFDISTLVESMTEPRVVSYSRRIISLTLIDHSGTDNRPCEATLNYFFDDPMSPSDLATIDILRDAVDHKTAATFFAIQGKQTDGNFAMETSRDFFAIKAQGTRAQALNDIASTVLQASPSDRDILVQDHLNARTNYHNVEGREILCAVLRRIASPTSLSSIEDSPTIWQLNWVEILWPTQPNLLTKDGTRLYFQTTLRDLSGSVDVYMNEPSALSLACVETKADFLSARDAGKQLFPVVASVKILRKVSDNPAAITSCNVEDTVQQFVNLIIVQAADQPLVEQPAHSTLRLVPLFGDSQDDTACILPAGLHMVHASKYYAFTVEYILPSGERLLLPCQKIMTVVRSTKNTLTETLGVGFKLTTPDVTSLWPNADPTCASIPYKLSTICTMENLPAYRLDPPRGAHQFALVTATSKADDTFIVEHVQLLDQPRAEEAARALQKLLQLAVHINQRDRKRTLPWTEDFSPKMSKKCMSLGCSPLDEPLPSP